LNCLNAFGLVNVVAHTVFFANSQFNSSLRAASKNAHGKKQHLERAICVSFTFSNQGFQKFLQVGGGVVSTNTSSLTEDLFTGCSFFVTGLHAIILIAPQTAEQKKKQMGIF
jgi:hypothetical protein